MYARVFYCHFYRVTNKVFIHNFTVKPVRQSPANIQTFCPVRNRLPCKIEIHFVICSEQKVKGKSVLRYRYLFTCTCFGCSSSLLFLFFIFVTTKQLFHTFPSKPAINLDLLLVNSSGNSSSLRLITENKV